MIKHHFSYSVVQSVWHKILTDIYLVSLAGFEWVLMRLTILFLLVCLILFSNLLHVSFSLSEPSVMDRLISLEKQIMGCQEKNLAQCRKEIQVKTRVPYQRLIFSSPGQSQKSNELITVCIDLQELKAKQAAFESKTLLLTHSAGQQQNAKEPVFKNTGLLQRIQSNGTKSIKQQAVVQPLKGPFKFYYSVLRNVTDNYPLE